MSVKISDYFTPTERQKAALRYIGKGHRVFYGGARGGGKSHFCLATAVLASYQFPKLKTVCIKKTYPELEDVFINNLIDRYPPEIFRYEYRDKSKTATFKNGSRIIFKACEHRRDAEKIHGLEYQLMIIDEANNYDEMTLHKFTGSLRNSVVQNFIPTLVMTGNPGGHADLYFKTRFVNPDFKYWTESERKNKDKYIFIPAQVMDNPHINTEYVDMLNDLPQGLKQAWLHGNWNSFQGQFFEEWNEEVHVVGEFQIPEHWERKAGIDLGFTSDHPTVVLWTAQNPDNGDVYVYREYVKHSSTEQYIVDIRDIEGDEGVLVYYGDPSMWNNSTKHKYEDESPAFMFLREGVPLVPANNKRVNGWRVLKQWLHWSKRRKPKLYIMDNCLHLIKTLPINRYNLNTVNSLEDLDTKGPDDAVDALRYVMMTGYMYDGGIMEETEDGLSLKVVLDDGEAMDRFKSCGYPKAPMELPNLDNVGKEYVSDKSWFN